MYVDIMFLLKSSSLGLDHTKRPTIAGKTNARRKYNGHHVQEANAGDAQELRVQRHDVQHVRHAQHQGWPGRRWGADDQQIPGMAFYHGFYHGFFGDTLGSHNIELGPCDMGNPQFCSQKGRQGRRLGPP